MDKKTFENEAYIVEKLDTLNFVTKSSTVEQRQKFNIGDLFLNGAVCLHCKSFVRSKSCHDLSMCKCGKVGVDGGSHYQRLVGEPKDFIAISEGFYGADDHV